MTVRELREKYLTFFESKGHTRVPSASLIPYDATGRLDESLLFNVAGMIQFKPYFRGVAQPESKRLTNSQKCVRTVDIDIVGDATHLTFFEMLGNFSFGDYFKNEAIAYSWEFLTDKRWLALDPAKLSFSIFEEDDEAYEQWSSWIAPTGIDPANRIFRLDEETNYWPAGAFSKGPPGPCGPNSEIFYWVSKESPPEGPYSRQDWLRDEGAGKWVEIWNDVFITYDWQGHVSDPSKGPSSGYVKDAMPELPFRSIDTGMGLERTALALAGHQNVYATDVFQPIFRSIESVTDDPLEYGLDEHLDLAMRVIADHMRTAVFCIADGILPGNSGRGYVLRRLIRRAVLKGQRRLAFEQPFLHTVYEGIAKAMGDFYTEIVELRETIVETLRSEEALFRRTLSAGSALLQEELDRLEPGKALAGDAAFKLYDTFGFPLEVTIELAGEAGVQVDVEGYEVALKDAQNRSRGATERESVYGGVSGADEIAIDDAPGSTHFIGYTCTEGSGRIVRIRASGPGRLKVALDVTPFYAESGGQAGDHGVLKGTEFELQVSNTTKSSGTFWHDVTTDLDPSELIGKQVEAVVQASRRSKILRNHTATHLLQAALRGVLGNHVTQAGSFVGPDNLRFDFTHGTALSEEQKAKVEAIVNQQVLLNTPVQTYADLPIEEAKAKGAMALFGEKYGNRVRMVEVGDFSRELCGGTHVRSTGEIGQFRISSESSAASGVRRIEAITGEAAYEFALQETHRLKEIAEILKSSVREVVPAVQRTLDSLKEERKRREKIEMSALTGTSGESAEVVEVEGVTLWRKNFGETDPKLATQAVDNEAAGKANQVTLAATVVDGKITFTCKAGPEAVAKGAHAGNLIKEVSKIAGGGGGGRPDFATAGGRLPEKVDEALAVAKDVLQAQLTKSS
jgi:alanyl-tRNA synthetase